ncbi:hypothetical protein WN943_023530 [Citrus x changshan-huyou]
MAQATAVRNLEDQVIDCGEAPDDFKPCRAIDVIVKSYDLAARLQAYQGQFMECWNSLQKLTSCSSLTVQFFLTGKADIASCCGSIDIIWSKCTWPSAVTSLGYTPAEANILKTYCDAVSAPPANRKP